jgi:hypothetical protein
MHRSAKREKWGGRTYMWKHIKKCERNPKGWTVTVASLNGGGSLKVLLGGHSLQTALQYGITTD